MKRNRRTAIGACLAGLMLTLGAYAASAAPAAYTTAGLSAEQLARLPGVTYARPLMEKPVRTLVVLRLVVPPARAGSPSPNPWLCHRPSGPVTVHVTKGALRLGLNDRPAQLVRAGGSLYEPAHSLHRLVENVSSSVPAEAVAVIAVPMGAPILTADSNCGAGTSR